jgi:hypothetical protein
MHKAIAFRIVAASGSGSEVRLEKIQDGWPQQQQTKRTCTFVRMMGNNRSAPVPWKKCEEMPD